MRRPIINLPVRVTLLAVALVVGLLAWAYGARHRSAPSTLAIGAVYPTSASPPPYTGALALDMRSDHVFVAATTGTRVLDMRTGTVLRTIPRAGDGAPLSLTADTSTGHIVVVGNGIQVLDGRTGAVVHSVVTPMYRSVVVPDR